MKIIHIGDIVGKSGRQAIAQYLPQLKQELKPDLIIANGENSAGGFGITKQIARDLFMLGVDVITTGNHAFDQRDQLDLFNNEDNILRPVNFPKHAPGKGVVLYKTHNDKHVLIILAQGQYGMAPIDDPCASIDNAIANLQLTKDVDAIIIEMHAEMTSEKYSLGHYLDGNVSLVVGTHTHIPTADYHIMENGTAFMCDLGMTGDYNSVIGMEKSGPVHNFSQKLFKTKLRPALGEATLCGVFVELQANGLAKIIYPIRIGGVLSQTNLNNK